MTVEHRPGWAAICLVVLALVSLAACRSLPRELERGEPSYALTPPTEGTLADFSKTCESRVDIDESCFLLLDRNDDDLYWRLALIDSAAVSIDVQTYLWARDFSGQLLFNRMMAAAERGVRVRLLVDDFLTRRVDRIIAALDQHPNVEIRLWNPGSRRRLGRNLEYLTRLRELNHRLHNKVLIVDNLAVISGGRNIADAYFGLSENYNFFDLDLLTVGPVVPPTSGMFDRYWNDTRAVEARNMYRRVSENDVPEIKAELGRTLRASPLARIVPVNSRNWDDRFQQGMAAMVPGRAEVVYDKPGELAPSQHALYGLKRFFDQAQSEVQAANAYLVPGEPFFNGARELEARGVDMSIITNSLGSTNQTIVHHAYARSRLPMLAAGVDVFEMKYHPAMQSELDTAPIQSSWVGLHAKAAVVDREHVFIGSFNFSPRSRNLNLEMGILVHSVEFGQQTAAVMDRIMSPDNAWQLALNEEGQLRWKSADGKLTRQPAQSFWRRIRSGLFGLLPFEQHL